MCDEAGVPHPTIISESGRAVVAYHSVLVFDVLGVIGLRRRNASRPSPRRSGAAAHRTCSRTCTTRHAQERSRGFHDAQQALEHVDDLFNLGYLPLEQRGLAENLFWAICRSSQRIVQPATTCRRTLQNLDEQLSDTYFCNFSLFQSIPGQLGDQAALPGHADPPAQREARRARGAGGHHLRLGRQDRPLRRPARREEDLALHACDGEPYYLGVFLVGAYQEILGDLHNLFGDTHAVHVSLDGERRRPRR